MFLTFWICCIIQVQAQNKNTVYPNSLAYKWLNIALEVTANDVDRVGAKPTIQARQLGIVTNTMFDAWAAYDAKAVGTQFAGKLRRPKNERTK
ncbi:MAG: DUF6851 domain-containing protein, partial [Saprospiraceae bacterium]